MVEQPPHSSDSVRIACVMTVAASSLSSGLSAATEEVLGCCSASTTSATRLTMPSPTIATSTAGLADRNSSAGCTLSTTTCWICSSREDMSCRRLRQSSSFIFRSSSFSSESSTPAAARCARTSTQLQR